MYVKNYFYAIYLLLCMKMWKYVKVTVSNNCYCLTFCNQIQLFAHEINIDEIICWHFLCLYFFFFLVFRESTRGQTRGRKSDVFKLYGEEVGLFQNPDPYHHSSLTPLYSLTPTSPLRKRSTAILYCNRNYTGHSIP